MPVPTSLEAVTKDDVKKYFGIATTDTKKDTQMDSVMPLMIERITRYCDNPFKVQNISNELPKVMEFADTFFVEKRPVVSITSVIENGVTLIEGTDYVCYKDEGRFKRVKNWDVFMQRPSFGYWESTLGKVVVTYSGGMELPASILQVFYEYVGIFCGMRTRSYVTNAGIEAVVSMNDVPAEFKAVLGMYSNARTL